MFHKGSPFTVRSSRFTLLGCETRQADGADVTYGTHETYVRSGDPPIVDGELLTANCKP